MVDFAFYRDAYLGSKIPENRFPQLLLRAQAFLEQLKRCYRVQGGEQAQSMALCAMAECLCDQKGQGVRAATVGGVSVRYAEDQEKLLRRSLYQAAEVYLDIYRGV